MTLLDGRELAGLIKEELAREITKNNLKLKLVVILVGNNEASEKYVGMKQRGAEQIGMAFELVRFPEEVTQVELLDKIEALNKDTTVTGMIVQLPISAHLNTEEVLESIRPEKDVDGLSSVNLGNLAKGLKGLFPATPEGVMQLIKHYEIPLAGSVVTVVGQSNLVGKPLDLMLFNEHATVLTANSRTKDLKALTLQADVIVSAAGRPHLITADMVKEGAVVIDVGTTPVEGRIVGDVDFDNVSKKASYITPNPGGVGPMTVAMLLSNVVKAKRLFE